MDIKPFIEDSISRNRNRTVELIRGLAQDELSWRPGPQANPVGFVFFHIVRTEDVFFHRSIERLAEVWEKEGWAARMPAPAAGWGTNWTAEQVADFQCPPAETLLAYGEAVRNSGLQVLKGLSVSRFTEPVRPNRPDYTVANALQSIITHEAHHQGQIDYLVGLLKNKFTL
ncbi:MAG: DinB family protein [Chloroflexi bacterium]|nr:DinB family protein [Chloroflexota bacterium]